MGSNARNTGGFSIMFDELPDDLLSQVLARSATRTVHGAEYVTHGHRGARRPCVDGDFHPRRHGRSAHASVLPHKIDDAPAAIALLDMRERERCDFGPPEAAAQ